MHSAAHAVQTVAMVAECWSSTEIRAGRAMDLRFCALELLRVSVLLYSSQFQIRPRGRPLVICRDFARDVTSVNHLQLILPYSLRKRKIGSFAPNIPLSFATQDVLEEFSNGG
jgi:hypothetical protein